jgi:hypothetical protein
MTLLFRSAGARARRALAAAGGAAALCAAAGCNLDVEDPAIVRPAQLESAAALGTLYGGAVSDFALGFGGDAGAGDEGVALLGGMRADEFLNVDTFDTRREVDQGTIREQNATNQAVFRALQRARVSAERAAARYAAGDESAQNSPRRAESLSLAGLTYALLAENYCSGIPFTEFNPDGTFTFGAPLPTEQVFQRALERFTTALAAAQQSKDARATAFAQVGRGRALLGLARFAEARAAVSGVPTSFSYNLEFSTNTDRQQNPLFYLNVIDNRYGVADREGANGLPFVSARDPRLPTENSGSVGLDGETPLFFQRKYPARGSSVPVANGIEARLIEAEAQLQAGDVTGFLLTHNTLRASVGLAPLTATVATAPAALVTAHFAERAFWLYATGHRLGDMRRLLRPPYSRPFASVFPVGEYPKGGEYGTEANLPVPFDERNNPQFTGCVNRTQ